VVQQRRGARSILTCLGENVSDLAEADAVTEHYLEAMEKTAQAGLDAHLAVKPTQLGLDQDAGRCAANLDRLLARAARKGSFVWLDMESSRYVDPTLALYRRARERCDRVGVALQAYLRRTPKDVEDLIPLGAAARQGRLPRAAQPRPSPQARRRRELPPARLPAARRGRAPARSARPHRHPRYRALRPAASVRRRAGATVVGLRVRDAVRDPALAAGAPGGAGRRLRVLISYGEHWFPWYMRRLAERPASVLFVVKSLVS
jgi:proline dehydrogenase